MIPPTVHGLPALVCVSAMQKAVRRGLELDAMRFAVELIHTSKAFCSMVTKRLEIISHEDIDVHRAPHIIALVRAACEQARDWYELPNPGKSRIAVGSAIRSLARAPKSREGDHFQAAAGLAALLENYKPTIPDWALDMHTPAGKRMGRGLEHFLTDGCILIPPQQEQDAYRAEAVRLWHLKRDKVADVAFKLEPEKAAGGRGRRS